MSRVEDLWERLVWAALRGRVTSGSLYGRPETGIAANVINDILRAADEIQDDDPNISRILCEHAYSLAQNLDPNSEGRGVLQFKTGVMSIIKQTLAKREGGGIHQSQDIARLWEFYKLYREKNDVDVLREEEMKLRESGVFSGNLGELERKTVKRKRVLGTLKVLGNVLEQLTKEVSPEEAARLIPEELKRVMESDAAMTNDLLPYNIIPLDAPTLSNPIVSFPEKYYRGLPKLPGAFSAPISRSLDMFDFLHYTFGFQKDSVSNQREHVHLLANEQSRLRIPEEPESEMSRAEDLWERLVRAALRGRVTSGSLYGRPETGIAANVPSSLGNRDIDDILRAADEIQDDDPNISRILCEHAYSLAQNLDPNSEGRGVLQFKTGLMYVIKLKRVMESMTDDLLPYGVI